MKTRTDISKNILERARRPRYFRALQQLKMAHDQARRANVDVWQLSLQLPSLHGIGIEYAVLTWLVDCKFAEHRLAVAPRIKGQRRFGPSSDGLCENVSCFILTKLGAKLADAAMESSGDGPDIEKRKQGGRAKPRYDRATRTLWYMRQVVKEFKGPAKNQELLLAAFEEDDWPPIMDDSLPPTHGIDSHKRLQDTVRRLNEHQRNRLIFFHVMSNGTSIRWEIRGKE